MPRVSHDQKQYYRSKKSAASRSASLSITRREMQDRLSAEGLNFYRKYLGQLINGIYAERTKRVDHATLNYALASFQDAMLEQCIETLRRNWWPNAP